MIVKCADDSLLMDDIAIQYPSIKNVSIPVRSRQVAVRCSKIHDYRLFINSTTSRIQ